MAEGDELGYSRGILEQLRASYEQMSREELLDLVCHLQKSYVLDQTIPFDFPLPERAEELTRDRPDVPESQDEDDPSEPAEVRFARLVDGLKRRTRLPQFEGFALEEGRAVLVVDNQKITFGERVTVEFVPLRQPPRGGQSTPSPAPARPAPEPAASAPPAPAPARPAPPQPRAPGPPRGSGRSSGPARPPGPSTRPGPRPTPKKPAPAPEPPPEDDGYDAGAERFRRLDLD